MVFKTTIRGIRNINRRRKASKLRWVYLDLDEPLKERPAPPKGYFQRKLIPPKLLSLAFLDDYFNRLSKLRNFEGIIINLRKIPNGMARIQSLRDLIIDFKAKGKKVLIYGHNFNFLQYYVASAADEICLQRAGGLNITGLQMRKLFFKDALEKRGYKADFIPISPYKSAADSFGRTAFSKEDKEQRLAVLETFFETIVTALCSAFGKKENEIIDLIDNAPYSAKTALDNNLIHRIISEEDLIEHTRKAYSKGKKLKIITVKDSLCKLPIPRPKPATKTIAIISVEGSIVDGKSRKPPIKIPIPFIGDDQEGDQTIVNLIRKAKRDKKVKGVVFHVNSGGGSAVSSEAMRSSIKELVKKKPLVVYFSDVAASGGYYIATSANWVVAQPTTLTGSIGILIGKIITQDGLNKQGINREYIRMGKQAGIFSSDKTFSEDERKKLFDNMNSIYEIFLGHVGEFRKMEREQFEKYCGGRIWSGRDALEIGLIDELGNIKHAINKVAEFAKLKPENCRIVDFYKAKEDVPIWFKDDQIGLFIDEWLEPYKKTHMWMILPEKIIIE
jgi:protease-4